MAGLAATIHKTYKSARALLPGVFDRFSITPLPTSEAKLCYFVTCLGQQGLNESSIRAYLAGIRHAVTDLPGLWGPPHR